MEQYVFVRLYARLSEEQAVEDALREVMRPSREEKGCLSFHWFRSMRDARLFFIPFTLGGRSSVSETGGFRAHGALSEEGRPLTGAAARAHSNAEDCLIG